MTFMQWNPMRDMIHIQQEMNRLMGEAALHGEAEAREDSWSPRVDVAESRENISVIVEVPGMSREDLSLVIEDNVLTLSGEKTQQHEEGLRYHRLERVFGPFRRTFSLPASIETSAVKAVYKEGVLAITLPKAEADRPKEIAVSVG